MNRMTLALACGLALFAPAACKIVKTAAPADGASADPDGALIAQVLTDTYDAKLRPLIAGEATDAASLLPAIASDLAAAGTASGHRGGGEGGSWTFAIKGKGVVTAENRQSKAATLDLDVTGDGKADLKLQLGPVVKGSALRDIAPFYDFTAFRDQIQFAKLGRALNDKATSGLSLPAEALTGKTVSFLGVFALHAAADPVLVVPLSAEVAP